MRRLLTMLFTLLLSACQCGGPSTSTDGGSGGGTSGLGGGSGGGAATGGGGGGNLALDAGLMEFCAADGPVPVPIGSSVACTGDLGKRVFTFAVCSCSGVQASNAITITGNRDGGGSLGVNGGFSSSNTSSIGGSLWTRDQVTSTNTLIVGRDVHAGGNVTVAQGHVVRDVFSAGSVISNGSYGVGGAVHLPVGAQLTNVVADGGVVREAVMVGSPCDCAQPVDVAGIVRFFDSVKDNTARSVAANLLSSGSPVDVTLECGRYVFNAANTSQPVRIQTRGRVVVVIDGDLSTSNTFSLVPQAGGQLDIFVRGSVDLANGVTLGDPARPWATRLYVGGSHLSSSSPLDVSANLYVGAGAFSASNTVHVRGAVFAGSIASSNQFTVDYDDGILSINGCAPLNGQCLSSRECSNPAPACVNGACARCQRDADCVAPLACDTTSGTCVEAFIER